MGMYRCLDCGKEFNKRLRFAWQKLKCKECESENVVMTGHW